MGFVYYPSPTPVFPVLPPLTWSVHKKPILSSRIITSVTGRSCQLATAAYPRWAFTLSYGGNSWLRDQTQNITPDPTLLGFTEFQQLSALFLACGGSYGEFYYDDPDDDSRSNVSLGTGDGTTTTFQFMIPWGSGPFTPPMSFPASGINTIDSVYVNDVLQNPITYGVDETNTKLVFETAPGNGLPITGSFHFYYRCRFLEDTLSFSQFAQNKWECKEVRFESVKP